MSKKIPSLVSSLLGLGLCAQALAACFSDTTATNADAGPASTNGGGPSSGGGGGGGSTTGGGGAGGGGTTTDDAGTGTPAAGTDMIDDMESGTGSILATKGRVGAWYTYNDSTAGATETPAQGEPFLPSALTPARGQSHYAARMQGSGFTTWGAGMGFNLNDPGNGDGGSAKSVYDASAYDGITFWAKSGTPAGASVRVNVSDKDTDPAGGVCAPAPKCSDHFGKTVNITADWAQYTIKFADMTQLGWGASAPKFAANAVYAVQFQVGKGTTFDVFIDDIAFLTK